MPKQFKINERPNPTGLTMAERKLAMDVLRSFETSLNKARVDAQRGYYWRQNEWTAGDERELRVQVYNSAYRQFTGRQKSENGIFTFTHSPETTEEDMDYIMESLGIRR
jgi:hypothetical protein